MAQLSLKNPNNFLLTVWLCLSYFLRRSKILFCKLEVSNINTGKGNIVEINEDHLNEDKQRLFI